MEEICANVDEEFTKNLVEKIYGFIVIQILKLNGYDDLNFHIRAVTSIGEGSKTDECRNFILKFINWRDLENAEFFNEYSNVLIHLGKEGIPCPQPIKNRNDQYFYYWIDNSKGNGVRNNKSVRRHLIILLTYLPGQLLQDFRCDWNISFVLGRLVSKLHNKLQVFNDSQVLKRTEYPWSLQAVPNIKHLLNVISLDEEKCKLVLNTVTQFENGVLSKMDEFEKGVIHNDINDANILVRRVPDDKSFILDIVGVIDFSDMLYSSYLFDIAIAVAYLFLNNPDDCDNLVKGFLQGYERRQLTDLELYSLKNCICARLCQSLIMGLHAYSIRSNYQYLLTTQKIGWTLLNKFFNMDNEEFMKKLRPSENSRTNSRRIPY